MTRVIAIANGKGGTTKTTATMSLAAVTAEGAKVLVVDCDPQGSAGFWADRAGENLPFEIAESTDPTILRNLRRAAEFDYVYVDTPGNLRESGILAAVLDLADYAVVPMPTAVLSVPPVEQTIETLIKPRGVPFRVLLSLVDGRHTADQADMRTLLEARGWPVFTTAIRRYVAHERAPLAGLVVTQYGEEMHNRNATDDYRRVALELLTDVSRTARSAA